jgi:hypothetical protein
MVVRSDDGAGARIRSTSTAAAVSADRLQAVNRAAGADVLWITEIRYFVRRGVIQPIGVTRDGDPVFARRAFDRLLRIARNRLADIEDSDGDKKLPK